MPNGAEMVEVKCKVWPDGGWLTEEDVRDCGGLEGVLALGMSDDCYDVVVVVPNDDDFYIHIGNAVEEIHKKNSGLCRPAEIA